jgi:hypothetical protein
MHVDIVFECKYNFSMLIKQLDVFKAHKNINKTYQVMHNCTCRKLTLLYSEKEDPHNS